MNSPYFSLVFSIVSISFFAMYFIFSYFNYDHRFNLKYDIKNTFPYEFNYQGNFKDNFLGNVMLIMSIILGIASAVCFDNTHTGFMIFTLVSGVLSFISIGALNLISLKELKMHIAASILNLVFNFMYAAAILVSSMQLLKIQGVVQTLPIFSLIIGILGLILSFGLIMNPRLTSFPNMIKSVDDKGKVTYKRPKYYVLAFSEWISTFSIMTLQIGMVILAFCTK